MIIKLICSKNTVAKNSDICRKYEEKCMRSKQNDQIHHESWIEESSDSEISGWKNPKSVAEAVKEVRKCLCCEFFDDMLIW